MYLTPYRNGSTGAMAQAEYEEESQVFGNIGFAPQCLWTGMDNNHQCHIQHAIRTDHPSVDKDWSYIFLQTFYGHVTLVPAVSVWDFFRLVSDPTIEDMRQYFSGGALDLVLINHNIQLNNLVLQANRQPGAPVR